jgi:hypothetical protein
VERVPDGIADHACAQEPVRGVDGARRAVARMTSGASRRIAANRSGSPPSDARAAPLSIAPMITRGRERAARKLKFGPRSPDEHG